MLSAKKIIGIIVLVFVIVKIPFLFLPYYWDEAWPYSVAIHTLVDNGLSFLPNAIPSDVSRGHPLMFHFLAALWMKIFGSGFVSGHSFSLFVSVILIVTIFIFCKTFFSERTGIISCILFCTQSAFLAQSVFLLPEVLLTLWTLLCFYFFLKKNKLWYVVFATFLLLTKESGAVLIGILFVWQLTQVTFFEKKKIKIILQESMFFLLPFVIASVFFIAQKIQHGWFFFPHHIHLISLTWKTLNEELPNAAAYLFIYYGRNGFSLFIIAALVLFFIRKEKFIENEKNILLLFGCFILCFLFFSSSFFFIPRYLLTIFPPLIIAGTVCIDKIFSKYKIVYPLIVTGLVITNIFFCFHKPETGEFKYLCFVKVQQQMVDYCEKKNLFAKHIYANFVLRTDLKEPYAGYISEKPFTNTQEYFSINTEYCIFSNEEFDKEKFKTLLQENNLKLIQRFEADYAWSEIYEVAR